VVFKKKFDDILNLSGVRITTRIMKRSFSLKSSFLLHLKRYKSLRTSGNGDRNKSKTAREGAILAYKL
jgi:hypothetical protein